MRQEMRVLDSSASEQAHRLKSLNILAGKISPHGIRMAGETIHKNPNAKANLSSGGPDRPDPDAIKMFVGQVPRHLDEEDVREMFEQFGPVYHVNILRDKVTGQSKGCCFVTFYRRKSALDAQNELHNIRTLPGMSHPIQMKPADTENRNERKLFVGMLNKKYEEADVRTMFSSHGPIEECTVLRDQNGQSRGCAFVTFGSRQYAIAAIKAMHQSLTMEGCSSPLVVKFADTQKEKDAKRLHSVNATLLGPSSIAPPALNPQYLALLQQIQTSSQLSAVDNPALAAPLSAGNPLAAGLAALSPAGLLPQAVPPPTALTNGVGGLKGLSSGSPVSLSLSALAGHQASDLSSTAHLPTVFGPLPTACSSALGQTSVISPLSMSSLAPMTPLGPYPAPASSLDTLTVHHLPGYPAYSPCSLAPPTHVTSMSGQAPVGLLTSRQTEGPDGCNLFIYHLPPEFSDSDLIQAFAPYGTVVSAKVFVDKQTNLSKCFGFVSYDCGTSALAAIQAMNGFQIGTKRLKVQLKRSKEANKPY